MQKVLQPPTLTLYSIGFKRSQNKNKHSKWMTCCKEHYCQKNTYININEKQYPHPLHPSIDKPPPLYGLTPPISPRKSWYPSPLNDFLKNSNPTINRWGGVRGGGHTMKYLYKFHFRYLKRCGVFSDNATIYEIEHCARWELLFALYSMIFIDSSYDIQIALSFCSVRR